MAMGIRKSFVFVTLLLMLIAIGAVWYWLSCGGVSHVDLMRRIADESVSICRHVDVRCAELDVKLDRVEAKLDRLEAKLDRLIEMATPKLPDGMKSAEKWGRTDKR